MYIRNLSGAVVLLKKRTAQEIENLRIMTEKAVNMENILTKIELERVKTLTTEILR